MCTHRFHTLCHIQFDEIESQGEQITFFMCVSCVYVSVCEGKRCTFVASRSISLFLSPSHFLQFFVVHSHQFLSFIHCVAVFFFIALDLVSVSHTIRIFDLLSPQSVFIVRFDVVHNPSDTSNGKCKPVDRMHSIRVTH